MIILAYSDYSCIFRTDISASRYFASLARSYGPWQHCSVQVNAHRQLEFVRRSTHSMLAYCWKEIGRFESAGSSLHPTARNTRGGLELRLDNVWLCRVLLLFLFKIKAQIDSGLKEFECAYVSVLERYTGSSLVAVHQVCILCIF